MEEHQNENYQEERLVFQQVNVEQVFHKQEQDYYVVQQTVKEGQEVMFYHKEEKLFHQELENQFQDQLLLM